MLFKMRINEKYNRSSTRMTSSFCSRLNLWQDESFCLGKSEIEDFYRSFLCVYSCCSAISKTPAAESWFFSFFSWQCFICSLDSKERILTITLLTVNNFSFLCRGNACWNLLCWMLTTESSSHFRAGKVHCFF